MSDGTKRYLRSEPGLILASASPRRVEILAAAGASFQVVPAGIDERPPHALKPLALARWAAQAKATAVARRRPRDVVLAADTVVALHGRSFGKPADRNDARGTLRQLAGRTHIVYTAVAVIAPGGQMYCGFSRTFVTMSELSPSVIARYVRTGEAQDKAGSYAIQGEGRRLVRSIRGPFDNVVGMPMHLVLRLLREAAVTVPAIKADGAEHDRDPEKGPSFEKRRGRPRSHAAGRAGAGWMRT